jgi:hypothetical protein
MRRILHRLRFDALAFLVYALGAIVFVWPLPTHLSTHITGDPAGDAGAYVWNAYAFLYNITHGSSVFTTDRILALAGEVSLALHNNSLVLSALAAPLIPFFGVVASFNLALIAVLALNPFCAYLLARHETGRRAESLVAGALFGFSPFIGARVEGHMSLATAFGLPLTVLLARLAVRRRSLTTWALVGVGLAICAVSDPYYLVFGILAVSAIGFAEIASLEPLPPNAGRWAVPILSVVIALTLAALIWIGLTGGGALALGGFGVGVRDPHTPVLVLTLALGALAYRFWPHRLALRPGFVRSLRYPAVALVVSAALLFPWLRAAAAEVVRKGGTESPLWRSSPHGVDLVSFLMPNPTNPLLRDFIEPWMTQERPDAFVEGVASLSLFAILIGCWLRGRGGILSRFWLGFTALFASLALGPFILAAGTATYVPGPWALLRYVPGIGMARSPTRFAVLATLGSAMVFARLLATAALGRHRRIVLGAIASILSLELLLPPRRIFATAMPEMYEIVAQDGCDVVVLRLPMGIKDGTRQRGYFSSSTQFNQIFHAKRLLGGYISRLSDETVAAYENDPTVRVLLDLSEGRPISAEARKAALAGAEAMSRRVGIGFIALNKQETSQELRDFVHEAFRPRVVSKSWPFVIYVPFGEECGDGKCGHRDSCPLHGGG